MKITDLTGLEYDEVETIVGKELDSRGVSGMKITRAVGFVLAKRDQPDLTWPQFNTRSVADQCAGVEFDRPDDEAGKAPAS